MTLEHWYFVAEIIAAFAVVFSLCFLAFELRRNSNHVKRQSMELLTIHRVEALKAFYEDEEMASIIWRGFAHEPRLPAHEWARFGLFLYSFFLVFELAFRKFDRKELDQTSWKSWQDGVTWWLRQPGVRSWWKSDHPGYCTSFTDYINRELGRVDAYSAEAKSVADSFADLHRNSEDILPDQSVLTDGQQADSR